MLSIQIGRRVGVVVLAIGALIAPFQASAQPEDGDDKAGDGDVVIDVTKFNRTKYPIAIPIATSGDKKISAEVHKVANFDMSVAGWFRPLEASTIPANLKKEGTSMDPAAWKTVGAFGVVKYRSVVSGSRLTLTFKLYEIEKGGSPVLEKTYKGSKKDARGFTHAFCNEMVKHFTGEEGFFGSKITFASKGRGTSKRIMAMDFDGHKPYAVSRNRYVNILPSFSKDGSKIAYTSYMRDNPDLYVASSGVAGQSGSASATA